jgi:hypothetical protein
MQDPAPCREFRTLLPAGDGRLIEEDLRSMKAILNVVALCAVIALVGGCNKSNKVSPGAVSEEKSGCCSGKSATECSKDKSTSMGAVSEQKSGCCSSKSGASMGAVSETKSCPASKSSCTGKTSG